MLLIPDKTVHMHVPAGVRTKSHLNPSIAKYSQSHVRAVGHRQDTGTRLLCLVGNYQTKNWWGGVGGTVAQRNTQNVSFYQLK